MICGAGYAAGSFTSFRMTVGTFDNSRTLKASAKPSSAASLWKSRSRRACRHTRALLSSTLRCTAWESSSLVNGLEMSETKPICWSISGAMRE